MDDLYQRWSPQGSWFAAKLGFDFKKIRRISVGLMGTPPHEKVECTIEAPRALFEENVDLKNFSIVSNKGKITLNGVMQTGQYVQYEGGDKATILNADRHIKGEIPVTVENWSIPQGKSIIRLSCEGGNPWIRLVMKPTDVAFEIDNPSSKVEAMAAQIAGTSIR
jgi:hypothetical protein